MSLQRRLLTVTSDLPGAFPLAYCPPGSICGMLSIPRALPPVTHGSALQAPERLLGSCDLTTHPYRTDVSQALCCLEGSTPEDREGLLLFIALRWMQDPGGVMVWLTKNIQACLRDFLAATPSMARKRHLASIARGLFGFCLAPSIRKPIRPIRLIRGKTEIQRTGVPLTRRRISLWLHGSLFVLPTAAILLCDFPSAKGRPDGWGGSVRQACLHG